ncbi:hypothetical protein BGW42_004346 [Actinomortierella wolfii]|nr:hypothetical protein BGW42_004346 [Actinomortierella wolfii]
MELTTKPLSALGLSNIRSFVGHRLAEVEELEIVVDDQERYLNHAAKMTRLRKIWIHIGKNLNYQGMFDFAEAMVKAIQLHHGPNQLRECHMIPNPFVSGPKEESLNSGGLEEIYDIDLSRTQRFVSLLPSPRQYPTIPRPDGSAVSLSHPFDPYLATIQTVWYPDSPFTIVNWKALLKLYRAHSHAQILQRFRGLTSLYIDAEAIDEDDENLLAWAAYEAEHYYHQPGGHQLGSLVRLESLIVNCTEYSFKPRLKIIQDGLFGFSRTLVYLKVGYPLLGGRVVDWLLAIPRPLHNLGLLNLYNSTIDHSSWGKVPNIKEMTIDFDFPWSIFHSANTNQSEDEQDIGTTLSSSTATTTAATTELQSQPPLPELWFHCPKLSQLTLRNRAINLLDPNCFHLSPNLQFLTLSSLIESFRESIKSHGVNSYSNWEALKVLHPARWTWDWTFPVLQSLILGGDLYELKFSWTILHSCPTLKWIHLSQCDGNQRFPLRVKGILDVSLDKNNNQMLPFIHNDLMEVTLSGGWDIEADELGCLLQVLPVLKKLEFECVFGIADRELVEITKAHPSLTMVKAMMKLTTKPPSDLGLSKIDYETMVSIDRAIRDEYDGKIPMERPCIAYSFQNSRHYAFWMQPPNEYDGLDLLFDNTQ